MKATTNLTRSGTSNSGRTGKSTNWRKGVITNLPLTLALLALTGCAVTNYNLDIHPGAFRVADELTVEPGQGGDDSSSQGGEATGGKDGAPGGSNVLRGSAMQGIILQIGTSAKPEATTRATVTAQSPNSTTDGGGGDPDPNSGDPE